MKTDSNFEEEMYYKKGMDILSSTDLLGVKPDVSGPS